jgi:hypothetical protein
MIIDNNLYLSNAQANILAQATYPSTNVIDLTQLTYRVAYNNPMWLICRVTTALTDAAGAARLNVAICTNNTADATTPNIFWDTPALLTVAVCILNYEICAMRLPDRFLERYLLMVYTVSAADLTGGAITTFLTPDKPEPFLL